VIKNKNAEFNFNVDKLEINAHTFLIKEGKSEIEEVESGRQGFLIDSGLCARVVELKINETIHSLKL
jgi:hypothetical protein